MKTQQSMILKNLDDLKQTLRSKIESSLITMGEHCCKEYEKALKRECDHIMSYINNFMKATYGINIGD
jgi:hypothetical protein